MRARGSGFFLNTNRAPLGVELHHAVALGVMDVIGKDRGAVGALSRAPELAVEARSVKDVVAQYQTHGALANEVLSQQKSLGQAIGARLNGVLDTDTPLAAVPQKVGVSELVTGCGDDQNVPNTRLHQRGKRVINHGFVIHGHELFADRGGQRVQPGARPTSENNALVCGVLSHGARICSRGDGVYRPMAELASRRYTAPPVLCKNRSIIWHGYCH